MGLGSVKVLVLQDAPYMKATLNEVVVAQRGDIVEIASGWYIDKMTAQGMVHYLQDGDDIDQILRDTEPVLSEEEQEELDAQNDAHASPVLDATSPLVRRQRKNASPEA